MSLLQLRSDLLKAIRAYFYAEGLLEVTTKTLRPYGASDPHLLNIEAGGGFLQTSPEYAMKCLLATYRQNIFQICPAYRGEESGVRHRTEFQMLEWYRCGFGLEALMDDLVSLLKFVGGELVDHQLRSLDENLTVARISYRELFQDSIGLNPHRATIKELAKVASANDIHHLDSSSEMEDYLDSLYSVVIEPGIMEPTIVYDYPACQAALSTIKTDQHGDSVADRFEFYVSGMELANAYFELTDKHELIERFKNNNVKRTKKGLPQILSDEDLFYAMETMPESSGIALGVDRLLMVITGADSIDQIDLLTSAP